MAKVAALVRVSGQEQVERESIQTQIEYLVKFCNLKEWNLVEVYRDDGVSGTVDVKDRPDGSRMLRDAQRGKFDILVVYKLDRLARSVSIVYDTLTQLKGYGVEFVSATEAFDTNTPFGQMLLGLMAVFAQWEHSLITERFWDGRKRVAGAGQWAGGVPPLGYRVNKVGVPPKQSYFLVVDEEVIPGSHLSEASLIRLIYQWIGEEGRSAYWVEQELNRLKVPPPQMCNYPRRKNSKEPSTRWRHTTIQTIIRNPVYRGEYQYGKENKTPITSEVPAIVTPELWAKAGRQLSDNKKRSKRNSKTVYTLSGLIRCSCCGYRYCGVNHRGKYRYYVCSARNAPKAYLGEGATPCRSPYLTAEVIEEQIWADIVQFTDQPQAALTHLTEDLNRHKENAPAIQTEIDNLTSNVKSLADARLRVQKLYIKGQLTDDQKDRELAELDAEEGQLLELRAEKQARLDQCENAALAVLTAEQVLGRMRSLVTREGITPEERQGIIRKAVRRVDVECREGQWEAVAHYVFSPIENTSIDDPVFNWTGFDVPYPVAARP